MNIDDLDRANLLRPYQTLRAYDVWALNLIAEVDPDPEDVVEALDHLYALVEERVAGLITITDRDIHASIYNASADLSARFYGLSKPERSGKSRAAVGRWLRNRRAADDGSETPEQVIERKPRRSLGDDAR